MHATQPTLLASALVAAASIVLLAGQANAQSSSSTDPLNGSSFVTPVYTVSNTFTPITTFPQASGGVQTVIGGPGPSPATSSYAYTYTVPTATLPATTASQVFASLASSGQYNTAPDAKALNPDPNNLQIADSAFALNTAAVKALLITVAAAAAIVLAL
ncbi:hypothetical protein BCV70DRAFT_33097 [Testicularia cyperi]|uniref:Uncharacterized protein n=1 Tax=Testicularia cyperi TaxID=1882483 RepID=A0A317XKU4_9BASI|nr:hypothetical protein BCV70DRAFT_33097 [Testicularia cyperi]